MLSGSKVFCVCVCLCVCVCVCVSGCVSVCLCVCLPPSKAPQQDFPSVYSSPSGCLAPKLIPAPKTTVMKGSFPRSQHENKERSGESFPMAPQGRERLPVTRRRPPSPDLPPRRATHRPGRLSPPHVPPRLWATRAAGKASRARLPSLLPRQASQLRPGRAPPGDSCTHLLSISSGDQWCFLKLPSPSHTCLLLRRGPRPPAPRTGGQSPAPQPISAPRSSAISPSALLHPKVNPSRPSLVAQWLRVCLPRQGTRVRALVWEDPTCRGATGPVSHNY